MSDGTAGLVLNWLPAASRRWWRRYYWETHRPLTCLLFLLPLVLLYEVGVTWGAGRAGLRSELLAHGLLRDALAWVGLVGPWVPPTVFVMALLVWHWRRGRRWHVRWVALPVMLLECTLLALPLLALSGLFAAPPLVRLLPAIGAGVYEELVFRLLLISGLLWLHVELLHVWRPAATWAAVLLAAAIFAAAHFAPFGSAEFSWKPFWFQFAAGSYLGFVFQQRGFGVVGGAHAFYNVLLVLLRGSA